jgi:hypothetical protein
MSKFELSVNYQKGRAGEINVIAEMTTRGYTIKDYTGDFETFKQKQKKGYDIEYFNTVTNEWDRADIKTNVRNGFTFLEVEKFPSGLPGWFHTCQADKILTYDMENNKCYVYSLREMRNYVQGRTLKRVGKNKDLVCIPVNCSVIKELF